MRLSGRAATALGQLGLGLLMALPGGGVAVTWWSVPTSAAYWDTLYDGYGSVTYSASQGITLQPQAATSPSETHAALTLMRQTLLHPQQDFILTFTATTEQQLRTPPPANPWEVFWLYFNYRSNAAGQKSTNYFLIKPNGVELGLANDALAQTYLYTAAQPALPVGQAAQWRFVKQGHTVAAWINGRKVLDFTGALNDAPGAIGLYCEDARVRVQEIRLLPLPRPALLAFPAGKVK